MPEKEMDVLALLKAKQQAVGTTPAKPAPTVAPGPTGPAPVKASAPAPVAAPLKDKVVETLEVTITAPTPRKHTVEIINKVDPGQVYPFLAQCSCGFQARTYSAKTAHDAAEEHLGRAKQPIVR